MDGGFGGGGEVEAVVQKESNRVLLLDFDLITGIKSSRGIRLVVRVSICHCFFYVVHQLMSWY